MKRYGYKFEKFDNYLSRAIDIRFLSILLALICGFGMAVTINDKQAMGAFLPVAFFLFVLSVGAEFFPKIFYSAIIFLLILVLGIAVYFVVTNYGHCIKNCDGWGARYGKVREYLSFGKAFAILVLAFTYCIPILLSSIFSLKASTNKTRNSD